MSIRKSLVYAAVVGLALAGTVDAQARAGGGGSFGSRGAKSFSTVPSTRTAPTVSPFGAAQPGMANSGLTRPATGSRGMFGSFGRGLMGGLLGAGLFGLLFGHGMFGGLGGLMSIFGMLIQFALIALLVGFAIRMFRSRQNYANAGAAPGNAAFRTSEPQRPGGFSPFGGGAAAAAGSAASSTVPIELGKADYDQFEATLIRVQTAFSNEDTAELNRLATRQVADEFASEIAGNRSGGVINRMSDIKFIRGDLAESWREAGAEYASVAMRYSLIDAMIERSSGRVVAGDVNRPQEVTEVWTFTRSSDGGSADWRLSAIQQGR